MVKSHAQPHEIPRHLNFEDSAHVEGGLKGSWAACDGAEGEVWLAFPGLGVEGLGV